MSKILPVFLVLISIVVSSCAQMTTPQDTSKQQGTTPTRSGQTTPSGTNSNSSGSSTGSQRSGATTTGSTSSSSSQKGLSGFTNDQMISGLKEALSIGAQKSSDQLSLADGYFKNLAVKILMPPEAKDVETQLRQLGMGKMVDDAILSMNRAAESAAKDAAPIFLDAIKHMSVNDAAGILTGPNDAATQYLKKTTSTQLTTKFKPVIQEALKKTDATKYWNDVFSNYNKIPFVKKVNPDLTSYVTQKALDGLFYEVAKQEAQIRKDPMGTANSIVEEVFGAIKR